MNFNHSKILLLIMLTSATLLSACTTPAAKARFYTLASSSLANSGSTNDSSTNNSSANQTVNLPTAAPIAIEVLPVNVPERLKRPQLVITTSNSSQLKILEQDRWSSSFNDELQDAFVSGISNQLNAVDISRGGRTTNQPTYRIAIVLQQFNATPGEQVQANFGWTITPLNLGKSTTDSRSLSCQATISKAVTNDIDAVVKGVQETVADTIKAISANVTSINNGEGKCGS